MVYELIYTILSVLVVSLISLIGIFTLSLKKEFLNKITLLLVGFAAGTLLGVVFLDLIQEIEFESGPLFILIGIILFFVIERFIHWHHCHDRECEFKTTKALGYLNLIGDAVHNFTDGVIIAAAYLVNIELGLVTTIAIAVHEIPQEIGDFAILVHSGFSRKKALFYNFLSALTAVIGALITYLAASLLNIIPFLIAVAAGGFIYIAVADLLPELHRETSTKRLLVQFSFFILGIIIIWLFINLFPH